MVRFVDSRTRDEEILDLVVRSYIKESRPVSSSYLCKQYNLQCSSATVRNVMERLERQGCLSHVHTSSGRVPTQAGFRRYVENIEEEELHQPYPVPVRLEEGRAQVFESVLQQTLDALAQVSRYASLVVFSAGGNQFILRGTRFIFDQPEFASLPLLRSLFYALEVRVDELQKLLYAYLDEDIKILVGDDIGFDEIAECSMLVSGLHDQHASLVLGLLGPMRMDYRRAASCLCSVREQLREMIEVL